MLENASAQQGTCILRLVVVAPAGWVLASCDFNLRVLELPRISQDLSLWRIPGGLFDTMVYLALAAFFAGMTYLVQNHWKLALLHAFWPGLAFSERAVSIPILAVIIGRVLILEAERLELVQLVRAAHRAGDRMRAARLLARHDVEQLDLVPIGQLFSSAVEPASSTFSTTGRTRSSEGVRR